MKERIIQIMNQEGLNPSKFAEEIGIQRAAMSHITSGRNNPSMDMVIKILERFKYVNPDWLIFGTGKMKRDNLQTNFPQQQPDLFSNPPHIPTEKKIIPEYRQENRDKKSVLPTKKSEYENVIPKETPSKKIVKIMLFYSDNTHEFFLPEK
jgi:transcriptional regulator with XRE-family HTH domain